MLMNAKAIARDFVLKGPLEKYLVYYIGCICTQSWCNYAI